MIAKVTVSSKQIVTILKKLLPFLNSFWYHLAAYFLTWASLLDTRFLFNNYFSCDCSKNVKKKLQVKAIFCTCKKLNMFFIVTIKMFIQIGSRIAIRVATMSIQCRLLITIYFMLFTWSMEVVWFQLLVYEPSTMQRVEPYLSWFVQTIWYYK